MPPIVSFLVDLFEGRTFVHGHVVGPVAFDQILWFFLRGADRVRLELDGGGDLFLDRSSDPAGFRVPLNLISNFEFVFHRYGFLLRHSCLVLLQPSFEIVAPERTGFSDTAS